MFKIGKYIVFTIMSLFVNKIKISDNSKNSLLFINTGQIGDLVVSSLILENDELFENYKCYFLIDKKYFNLFSGYKGSVKVLTFNKKKYKYSLLYRLKILKTLRLLNINTVYNITADRGFVNDEISLLSGAGNFIATLSDEKYLGKYILKKNNYKYNLIIYNDLHNEYEKTVNLISDINNVPKNKVIIKNNKTFSISNNYSSSEKYITISPFTSKRKREWGIFNYKYLVENLSKHIKIVLIGASNQKRNLEKLKNNTKNVEISVCQLDEVPGIINKSLLFFGNDSGLTHISYRLGKPTLIILGGGFYGKFFPSNRINEKSYEFFYKMNCYGCNWNCIYEKPYCITNIDKDVVLNKILKILNDK